MPFHKEPLLMPIKLYCKCLNYSYLITEGAEFLWFWDTAYANEVWKCNLGRGHSSMIFLNIGIF